MKLVTAVMAARGRVSWSRQALDGFLSQTYFSKYMVIIDDDDDPAFPDGVSDRNVYYARLKVRDPIPRKLNTACEIANSADYIAKWDSDDWYCPTRIADQVRRLEATSKAVTGYQSFRLFEPATGKAFEYRRTHAYACGSSLMFLRSFWETHRFKENKFTGSDNHFVYAAVEAGQLDCVPGEMSMVARIHPGNTSRKDHARRGAEYHEIALDQLPQAFLELESVTV